MRKALTTSLGSPLFYSPPRELHMVERRILSSDSEDEELER
jgi:hypothetical protein